MVGYWASSKAVADFVTAPTNLLPAKMFFFLFSFLSGKQKCQEDPHKILKVLSDLLGHENTEVRISARVAFCLFVRIFIALKKGGSYGEEIETWNWDKFPSLYE